MLNLVATLLSTERPLRAEELRERVPGYPDNDAAFQRAFSRDKALLRGMDIPLTVEYLDPGDPEAGQGYRIPRRRYELPELGLEPDEVAALQVAATAVRLEGNEATEAIWKLGGVGPDERSPVVPGTASLPGSEHLPVLFGAATGRQRVRFGYRGDERTVDPWQLSFRNGFWYVTGWDEERAGRRTFRLDRITSSPRVDDGPASSRSAKARGVPARWAPWEMGDEDPVEVTVVVDPPQARLAVAAAGQGAVREWRPDGSVVLVLEVTNRAALRTFVLGLLDHGELVDPPEERAGLVEWLEAGLESWSS